MRSCNQCCSGKAVSFIYCERASVAVIIQYAKRWRRIMLPSVTCLAVQYFSTLSHKRHDYWKNWLNIKCVFWFSVQIISCLKLFSFEGELSEILSYMYLGIYVKCPLFLSELSETWTLSTDFWKIPKCHIPWKSVQWERAVLVEWTNRHTDRRTWWSY